MSDDAHDTLAERWRPLIEREPTLGVGSTYHGQLDGAARPDHVTAANVLRTLAELQAHATVASIGTLASAPSSTAAAAEPATYHIVGEVGRGGMGVVYRARQEVLGRDIALKKAHTTGDTKFVAEALITAGLEHPNIVPVYDLTTSRDATPALAMKLVGGTTWEKALDAPELAAPNEERDLDFHLDVLLAVANAIAFAHSRGIVHLDIKPENVLLGAFGEVLVVDWGIALDYRDEPGAGAIAPPRAALRSPCGTPAYLAPELALAASADIGPATDVYLLGATLFHVATGRAPRDHLSLIDALVDATRAETPPFRPDDRVPEPLAAIITKAMARRPADRYPTVAAFQEAVRAFRRHRESVAIASAAQVSLAAGEYAEAVAALRQALVLWPANDAARHARDGARIAWAGSAIEHGDLGLAGTQADSVLAERDGPATPAHRRLAKALQARVARLQMARRRARRVATTLRWTLGVAIVVIIAGLAIGTWLVLGEKEQADQSRILAETRLGAIQRLSDVKRLAELEAESDELWPAVPDKAPELARWLGDARALVARLPTHRAALAAMAAPDQSQSDAALAARWEHDTLAQLVSELERLAATKIPEVERRAESARTLATRSLETPRAAWQAAISAVAASPRYAAMSEYPLTPQLGLVPLGADPDSGLQEFAHLPSGDPATRGPDGHLVIGDTTGVVLVLVPGGSFDMGARLPDATHPEGSPNVDANASAHEGPVHRLTLAPFFIAKYEVTQAQWVRLEGQNPSAYQPGRDIGGHVVTLRHPVEQVAHSDASEAMRRLGLMLPTEAQWEYAARAGTSTPFWTGTAPESLAGTLNIADAWCRAHEGPGSWAYELWLDDGYTSHAPVGSYRPNPFGLHDVNGNVWEWCADHYGDYHLPVAPGTGARAAPENMPFVFRGGGLRSNTSHARSADRYSLYGIDHRGFDVGLRAARALDPR